MRNWNNNIQPFATRVLTSRSVTAEDETAFEECTLVPGGRFLVTKSVNDAVHLWDLGFSCEAMIDPFPVASLKVDEMEILAVQPNDDGFAIHLLTSCPDPEYVSFPFWLDGDADDQQD